MKLKHIPATIDINSRNEQRIAGIVNINDKKTRYLDVTIIASGEKLDLSGCTVTAIFVIDDVLVNNAVDCTVTNNIVTIPLENFNGRYGYLSIELNIVKDGTVIVNTPIPLKIQVTSSIADSAKISEKTYGTIAETVKEVYDARGTYENLSNRLTDIDNEITDIDETVTMKINLKADKATTLAGYGITDAYDKTYLNKALDSTNAAIEKAKSETDNKLNEINASATGVKSDLIKTKSEIFGNPYAPYSYTWYEGFMNAMKVIQTDIKGYSYCIIPVNNGDSYEFVGNVCFCLLKTYNPNGVSVADRNPTIKTNNPNGTISDGYKYIYVRNDAKGKLLINGYSVNYDKALEESIVNSIKDLNISCDATNEKLNALGSHLSEFSDNDDELFGSLWKNGYIEYGVGKSEIYKGYLDINSGNYIQNNAYTFALIPVKTGYEFNIVSPSFHGFLSSFDGTNGKIVGRLAYPINTWEGTVPTDATLMYLCFTAETKATINGYSFTLPIEKNKTFDERIRRLESDSSFNQKYKDRPEKGYENFSVKVNYTDYTQNADDSEESYYDYGVIALPKSYSANHEPTRLIIYCQGTGERINSDTNPLSNYGWEYFTSKGYAVMDMNGIAPKWGSEKGFPMPNQHYCNKYLLDSYAKGYDWVMENYNLKPQVLMMGLSMGGGASALIVQSGIIPCIAHACFCPAFSVYKQDYMQPWGGVVQQKTIAGQWGFENWDTTEPSKEYFLQNIDKIVGFDNLLINTIGDYDKANNNYGNQDEADAYNSMVKFYPVPLKIWHCEDDKTVLIRYSRFMVNMIRNGGGKAWLRTFDTGSHFGGWATGSVTDTDLDGNEVITTIPFYEARLFFDHFN